MIAQAIKHYSDYKTWEEYNNEKYLMKIKVNMLIVLIISLLGGMAGSYFFNNRWLGLIVAIPLLRSVISIRYIRCRPITANSTPKETH